MPTLTWTGKEDALRAASQVPFRLLESHTAAGDANAAYVGNPEAARDNLLIQGDNLDALKALLPYYAGRVKCVYIDPPYNTGSAFEHYDDNLEHSTWLSMMYPRLELLRELLREDGSIWVNLDDNEGHYAKVVMDEIFGRNNFIDTVIWQKIHARNNTAQHLSADHDFILVFAKNLTQWKRNKVGRTEASDADFWNPDNDPRGEWRRSDLTASKPYSDGHYEVKGPHGDIFSPRGNRFWSLSRSTFDDLLKDNRIWWGKNGKTFPFRKRFKSELGELVPTTVWLNEEVGNNREAKQEIAKLFGRDDMFSTPKPERLLQRIIHIATNPGDLVLDSFLGCGTTAAVAHKMGRRWIGVEMGDHAVTHCLPRLKKVVEGEQGGISEAVGWKGGGGFRFVDLGETVFRPDGSLNPKVSFKALAAHIWWRETGAPRADAPDTPLIGVHEGTAYYLLYNGILGDKRPEVGNVLTPALLSALPAAEGRKVVFAEACLIPARNLERLGIVFRQVPYDLGGLHA